MLTDTKISKFGLIGEKLGHSYSPQIHALLGDYPYDLYEVDPSQLERFIKQTELSGMNVTIPYKQAVMPLCAVIDEAAIRIGSVNTLVRRSDGWHGYNTDYDGFRFMVEEKARYQVHGKKGVILGNGGAAQAVRTALGDMGAGEIVTVSRRGPVCYEDENAYNDADFIVQATPVGMYPDGDRSVISLDVFRGPEAVFDLIYNPSRTCILKQAAERGMIAENGLSMLVVQAVRASEIFMNNRIDDERIQTVLHVIEETIQKGR